MAFHLFTGKNFKLAAMAEEVARGERPHHSWWLLSTALGATLHEPTEVSPSLRDKVGAKALVTSEALFAYAWQEAATLQDGDVAYCTGEDIGLPLAAACARQGIRAKIAIYAHNLSSKRKMLALGLGLWPKIDLWFSIAPCSLDVLRTVFRVKESKLAWISEQTDMRFFSPGAAAPGKTRPIVASAGLEMRDYVTLARATERLDADVRIAGFSHDAKVRKKTFPDPLPANMTSRAYSWRDLAQLYRDADVVAVPLLPNRYCAGITNLGEAFAARRPVVVTLTEGLRRYFKEVDFLECVPCGDPAALREAIERLLADPKRAEQLAARGYAHADEHMRTDAWIAKIKARLLTL